jgi:hypothetical protein
VVDGHKITVGIRARPGAVRVDLGQLWTTLIKLST